MTQNRTNALAHLRQLERRVVAPMVHHIEALAKPALVEDGAEDLSSASVLSETKNSPWQTTRLASSKQAMSLACTLRHPPARRAPTIQNRRRRRQSGAEHRGCRQRIDRTEAVASQRRTASSITMTPRERTAKRALRRSAAPERQRHRQERHIAPPPALLVSFHLVADGRTPSMAQTQHRAAIHLVTLAADSRKVDSTWRAGGGVTK
jgi:hypothetical protein